MSGYIEVVGWQSFQHYKGRNPPWIKLHRTVLDDHAWGRLQDASKAHLMGIWLLASRYQNKIPADPTWIARRIEATSPVDLQALVDAGFIVVHGECVQDASAALADCKPLIRDRDREERDVAAAPRDSKKPRTRKASDTETSSSGEGKVTWLTPFQVAWDRAYGEGAFASVAGHAAKVFRPHKDRPPEEIERVISAFAEATEPQYATPSGCARTWGAWAAAPAEDYTIPVNGWMSPELERLTRPA